MNKTFTPAQEAKLLRLENAIKDILSDESLLVDCVKDSKYAIVNPSVTFSQKVREGYFNSISDVEYEELCEAYDKLSNTYFADEPAYSLPVEIPITLSATLLSVIDLIQKMHKRDEVVDAVNELNAKAESMVKDSVCHSSGPAMTFFNVNHGDA